MSLQDYATRSISCLNCSRRLEHVHPKKLLCNHAFCEQCLTLLLSTGNTGNMVTCLVCQHTTPVLNGSILSLDTDVELQSKIRNITDLIQKCTNCESNNTAEIYCEDCDHYMCNMCLENHKMIKSLCSHVTHRVDDIKEGRVFLDKKIPCKNHIGDAGSHVCTLVCITCKKAICENCRIVVHSEHNVLELTEYKVDSQAKSEVLLKKAEAELGNAKRRIETVMEKEKATSTHINNVIGSTRERAATTIQEVRDRENILIQQSEDHKQKISHKYQEFRRGDDKILTQVESASELLRRNTSCRFGANTVAIRTSLTHRLQKMFTSKVGEAGFKEQLAGIAEEAKQIKFTPDENKLLLGHITFDDCASSGYDRIVYSYIPETMTGASSDMGERNRWKLIKNIPLHTKSPMQCLAAMPDGRMAAGTKCDGIIMCSTSDANKNVNRKPSTKHAQQISAVSGMAFTSKGYCVVRTRCNKIAMFTANWDKLDVTFQTIMTAWTFLKKGPCGNLTVDGDDYIYVNHIRDRKIEVFAVTGGKALRTIHCREFKPQEIFAMKSRKMLVSSGDQSVSLIDECGCIRKQIHKDDENVFCALRPDDSILLARVKPNGHGNRLLTIEHYSQDLDHLHTIISDQKIKVQSKTDWLALQESLSGDIVFCTSESLYLFSK